MGGLVSGALTGLGADLAAGGLTFGAGMLAGALVGALGGAGVARGVNVVRGKSATTVRWQEPFLERQLTLALLRYLAVAHFGRGRAKLPPARYRHTGANGPSSRWPTRARRWRVCAARGGGRQRRRCCDLVPMRPGEPEEAGLALGGRAAQQPGARSPAAKPG
jgi:hypothetical protein